MAVGNSREVDGNSRDVDGNSREVDGNSREVDGNSREVNDNSRCTCPPSYSPAPRHRSRKGASKDDIWMEDDRKEFPALFLAVSVFFMQS